MKNEKQENIKLAIPSEGKDLSSNVCMSFGRTHYFIVVDSETLDFEVIDNVAVSSQGGAGIKAAQSIVDSKSACVITFNCGQNAADVLKAGDIKIYKAVTGSISDMVTKFNNGELEELTNIHPGYHNHGGK